MWDPAAPLSPVDDERALVERAAEKAFVLYEGRRVAHRPCAVALAETFGVPVRAYVALRRGGLTGEGECGAVKAGELIIGEIFGGDDPLAPPSDAWRAALADYRRACAERIERGGAAGFVCNDLTGRFAEFAGPARAQFCTNLASEAARILAETILRHGGRVEIGPIPRT